MGHNLTHGTHADTWTYAVTWTHADTWSHECQRTHVRAVVRSKLLEGPVLMDPENFWGARFGASIDF